MKIIKVKCDTRTFVYFFLQNFRKINFKYICNIHYSDNTVLISFEDTRAPTVRENLEYKILLNRNGDFALRTAQLYMTTEPHALSKVLPLHSNKYILEGCCYYYFFY